MPAPVITAALIGGGLSVIDRFLTHLETKDLRALQARTLDQMTTFNNDLLRRARGKFTDSEIAQIKRNAEPSVNAVAGNVAARGLTGAAGASIVADAQQAPFFAAQDAATKAVPGSLQALMKIINENLGMMEGDADLGKEFGELIGSYARLKGLNNIPGDSKTPGQGYGDRADLPIGPSTPAYQTGSAYASYYLQDPEHQMAGNWDWGNELPRWNWGQPTDPPYRPGSAYASNYLQGPETTTLTDWLKGLESAPHWNWGQ